MVLTPYKVKYDYRTRQHLLSSNTTSPNSEVSIIHHVPYASLRAQAWPEDTTTVMIRNIAARFSKDTLLVCYIIA